MVKASLHPAALEAFFDTQPSGATEAERLGKQMPCERGLSVFISPTPNAGNGDQGTISSFEKAQRHGFLPLCLGKSVLNMEALSTTSWSVGIAATGSLPRPTVAVLSVRHE